MNKEEQQATMMRARTETDSMYLDEALAIYLYLKDQANRSPRQDKALSEAWHVICREAMKLTD